MDISLNSAGTVETLSDDQLLLQKIIKAILTERISGGDYGSNIYNTIGKKATQQVDTSFLVMDIMDCLRKLRKIQSDEAYFLDYDDNEIFETLETLKVVPNNTYFDIYLSIKNKASEVYNEQLTTS